jgi:hypothetical protein
LLGDDERYRWLNDRGGTVFGEVRPREGGGFGEEIEVHELVWEALGIEPAVDA